MGKAESYRDAILITLNTDQVKFKELPINSVFSENLAKDFYIKIAPGYAVEVGSKAKNYVDGATIVYHVSF